MTTLAAALMAGAVWIAWPVDQYARVARVLGWSERGSPGGEDGSSRRERRDMAVALLAGFAAAAVIGGAGGMAAGCGLALLVRRLVARLEPAAVRLERAKLAADLPLAAALLAASVRAGASVSGAAEAVGRAMPGPLGDRLTGGAAAAAVGVPPEQAWQSLVDDQVLAKLGRTLVQAETAGASPVLALAALAEDAAAMARWAAQARARSLGPRAALPLGVCFLPAFLIVGVVPFVVSVAGAVLP